MDLFTETTSTGWFGRIGKSIKGVLVGGVLFLVCIGVLFWNEGRAVKEAKRIAEGEAACVAVDSGKLDPANEGKLIHISGEATTSETLSDAAFGVSAPALRLRRLVEMYQWKETRETETRRKLGGGEEKVTTYTYNKVWDEGAIESKNFKRPEGHENPGRKPYSSMAQSAKNVTLGAFKLSETLTARMDNYDALPISEGDAKLPDAAKGKVTFHAGGLYLGESPEAPRVGDTRIKFSIVRPGPFSLIAQQTGGTFKPFVSAHGETEMLTEGTVSAEQMFQVAKARNTRITWLLRVGGVVVMWIGLMMIVNPLKVLGDVIPFIGSMIGFAGAIIAALVAGVVSMVVIAVAWIVYRPLLGICLLAVAAGLVMLIRQMRRRAAPQGLIQPPPVPPPPPIPS